MTLDGTARHTAVTAEMDRQALKAKIVGFFRKKIEMKRAEPHRQLQIQLNNLHGLVTDELKGLQPYQHDDVYSIVNEIVHEFIGAGFLYPGLPGMGSDSGYPWLTITEHGFSAFMEEDWLPHDPEGYLMALKGKVPTLDDVTVAYIGESVAAFNRRNLLSATITLGVASENLMLFLIEAYAKWLKPPRDTAFQKRIADKWISTQYKEFKKEFAADVRSLPPELQGDWETYLDGIFNFVRLNRNSAGHPTGKKLDAKVVYANLQIFAEYASYIEKLKTFLV